MPTIYDILSEPNADTLKKQHETYASGSPLMDGKFMRIGKMVLFAPLISCDPVRGITEPYLQHKDILLAAFDNPDREFASKVKQADAEAFPRTGIARRHGPLSNQFSLMDAGHYAFEPAANTLHINGKSAKFGRANEDGRAETIRLTRQAIGEKLTVIGD